MLILFGEGYDYFYESSYFGGIIFRPSRMMRFTHKSGTTGLWFCKDPPCSACEEDEKEEEETLVHFSGKCCAYMVTRNSIMAVHLIKAEILSKVRRSTLMRFARVSKRFSGPSVLPGMRIGPN